MFLVQTIVNATTRHCQHHDFLLLHASTRHACTAPSIWQGTKICQAQNGLILINCRPGKSATTSSPPQPCSLWNNNSLGFSNELIISPQGEQMCALTEINRTPDLMPTPTSGIDRIGGFPCVTATRRSQHRNCM